MVLFHKRTMTIDVCNEKNALPYTAVSKRTNCILLTANIFWLQMVLWIVYAPYILHLNILIFKVFHGHMDVDKWHGHMDMATQTWTHGHKHKDMNAWMWTYGHGHGH
jgi:hypothetical protein